MAEENACILYSRFEVSPCIEVRQVPLQVFQIPEIQKVRFNCKLLFLEITTTTEESQYVFNQISSLILY